MEIFVHRFMQCAPLVGYRWNDIRLSEECQVNILKRVSSYKINFFNHILSLR